MSFQTFLKKSFLTARSSENEEKMPLNNITEKLHRKNTKEL